MATLLAVIATSLTPTPATETRPYWQRIGGCPHGYEPRLARRVLGRQLRNHRPLTAHATETARRVVRCQQERSDRRRLAARRRVLRRWRMSYAHRWPIVFNRLSPWERAWAWSTGACESGNTATTSTGNGYHGAFQFAPSTWWAAGGTGYPEQHSWHYQAVVAVRWMHRAGASQWPVCG
jgi:Transglycosylase-like domain